MPLGEIADDLFRLGSCQGIAENRAFASIRIRENNLARHIPYREHNRRALLSSSYTSAPPAMGRKYRMGIPSRPHRAIIDRKGIQDLLRIRSRRFAGRCARHKRFNPAIDGRGGIKGACPRCTLLADIWETALKLNGLIRRFDPNFDDLETTRPKTKVEDERQMSLLVG